MTYCQNRTLFPLGSRCYSTVGQVRIETVNSSQQVAAGLAAGFREYETKPLDIKQLLNLIHEVLLLEQNH